MKHQRQVAYKFKVKQEYEVIIYYEEGILSANQDEEAESLVQDVLDLAFNHEGLVVMTEEANDNSNPYIGLVTTFDPELEEVYSIKEIPSQIKQALAEKGLLNDKS